MTDVNELTLEFVKSVSWTEVPQELTQEDYAEIIRRSIRMLYIATGRELSYTDALYSEDENGTVFFQETLSSAERDYVLITAEILFYKRVQNDVSQMISYTTDALSVANGDKPYANLKATLEDREKERMRLHSKMIRYKFSGIEEASE